VLFYGGREIMAGRLTTGDILVFNVYIAYLSFPLSALGIVLALQQRARAAIQRLRGIDEAPEERPLPLRQTEERSPPLLEVRDLTFSFGDGPPLLRGISF